MSSDVTQEQGQLSRDSIRARVKKYNIRPTEEFPESDYPYIRRCGVLVPLFFKDGDVHILFTVRAATLRHHPSTVSLPGGRKDPTDVDDVSTALRESEEEIGLPVDSVEPIGCLAPTCARPNYSMFPVVGLIPDNFVPKPNQNEVSFVFSVPLSRFLSNDFIWKEVVLFGRRMGYSSFPIRTEKGVFDVWGATANICVYVAGVVYGQSPPLKLLGGASTFEEFIKGMGTYYHTFCEEKRPGAKL